MDQGGQLPGIELNLRGQLAGIQHFQPGSTLQELGVNQKWNGGSIGAGIQGIREMQKAAVTKLIMKILSVLLLAACIISSCKDENESTAKENAKLLLGHWNSYESGYDQSGFSPGITTNLTLQYESGISFAKDGTFRSRYHYNGVWTESDVAVGTYELRDHTISLLFSPGTIDESKLDLQLIKLDQKHLWIKHSTFVVQEHHLERAID